MNSDKQEVKKRSLTEKEAANYIGLAPQSLREARCYGPREGHFPPPPHVKLGRCIRFLKDDLDKWLEKNRVEPEELPNSKSKRGSH